METIKLPSPVLKSGVSVEEALLKRRSIRKYEDKPLSLNQLSQLLWAANGITNEQGFVNKKPRKAAPSAGATYPISIYFVAINVSGLPAGIYKYNPDNHQVTIIIEEDKRISLRAAANNQLTFESAPLTIVIAAKYENTTGRYGERGVRYVHQESGHIAQNIALQAVALGLGTVMVGAFDDAAVTELIGLKEEDPLYLIPVGISK
jgi:SagB-type dehydrogenase family enzyme